MRKIIEYTLISTDGVFSGPQVAQFMGYRDDAYMRDGLGQLMACEAMLMGRTTYENFANIWPGRVHPWADRINTIPKYVFSSTLEHVDWTNSTLVRGDVATKVAQLKQQEGGDLLVYGHGLLARTLWKERLLDVLDLSIHPVVAGSGQLLFQDGPIVPLKLVATKTFSNIVKLTYQPETSTSRPPFG